MILVLRVLGTQMNELKSSSYQKIQLEQVLLDLPFVRKIKINIKISQILPNKRGNWYLSHHKMHSGMLSRSITINIKISQLS